MKIEFANEQSVIDKITRSLADSVAPRCWCVVSPPGFADETELAHALANALRRDSPGRLVAVVSADALRTRDDYVHQLSSQWYKRPATVGTELSELLAALTADGPGFQVLMRFHKIVRTLDQWVLGDLRDAEQSRRLRTVTLSPLSYPELKRRWKAESIPFCVSDYGDQHLRVDLRPPDRKTIDAAAAEYGAPKWLIDLGMQLTGGYPLALHALFDRWNVEGRPAQLRREVRAALRSTAEQALARFLDFLDGPREERFRNAVCDLYQGLNTANARYLLTQHDWRDVLLDEKGLLAECVGSLAEKRFAAQTSATPERWYDLWRRGRDLYDNGHYEAVGRLFGPFPETSLRAHLYVLRQHARIMELLYGPSFESSDISPRWRELEQVVQSALSFLARFEDDIPDADIFLRPRLEELESIAVSIRKAMSAGRRYVDILSGLDGSPANGLTAALLLAVQVEAGRRVRDHEAAIRKIMVLPEQIFRSWAKLRLGLNYYSAPDECTDVWCKADKAWCENTPERSSLKRAERGKSFPSFACFAYFALAYRELKCPEASAPEENLHTLQSCLSFLEAPRNDSAHALTWVDESTRRKYFDLTERWLDVLCAGCPNGTSRQDLMAQVEPLPLVGEDGRIIA